MASGSGWNLWVWLVGVVVRRYIDFLILLIPSSILLTAQVQSIDDNCGEWAECMGVASGCS